MHLGIDFDNTIVSYDRLFHRLAGERRWIDPQTPMTKTAVRDAMRAADREKEWTLLQGLAYGPRIVEAVCFPGVLDFMRACAAREIRMSIVSHKTRHPYAGPPHDLHDAAWSWLAGQRIVGTNGSPLKPHDVFFELTLKDKLRRIAKLGCTHFIDDLPECLADREFPPRVQRILFDPAQQYADEQRFHRVTSWTGGPWQVLEAAA